MTPVDPPNGQGQPQQVPTLNGLPVLTTPQPFAADFAQIGHGPQGKIFVLRLRNSGGQIECWGTEQDMRNVRDLIDRNLSGIEIARNLPPQAN
jgi:hypothetical protein